MGRWLSVVDPSSTTGRCEVEKNCQRGHCKWASLLTSQMGGGSGGKDGNRCVGEKGEVCFFFTKEKNYPSVEVC